MRLALRALRADLSLAALACLLAACRPVASSGPPPAARAADAASEFVATAPGRPGGVLRVSVATDPQGLDNHASLSGSWWGRIVGDHLVYLDPEGKPSPYLAKSWDISPDGLVYTFHLRDDVTFADGAPFDAEAVLANFQRIQDPATQGALSTAMLEPYLEGRVLAPHVFQATLRRPFGFFLHALATNWFCMLSPEAIRANPRGLADNPVGTGPFVVQSYERNRGVRFVRRPDYRWAPDAIRHQGPAYLDAIEIEFVPEPLARQGALASGLHDLTLDLAPQSAASVRADPRLVLANRLVPGNPVRGPVFNTEQPPFDDVRVRRAFALAVDREGAAHIAGFGEYRAKSDFLSAQNRHHDPASAPVLAHDPAAAGRLLDEAGWTGRDADGYRTRDDARLSAAVSLSDPRYIVVLVAIQSDLKKVGFDLRLEQIPNAQRLARVLDNRYQAMQPSFAYTGNSPDGLNIHYHSSQINTGRFLGQNASRLRDPLLDDLLDQGRATLDETARHEIYARVQHRLVELVPAVPLYENHALIAYREDVRGVLFDTSSNRLAFTTVWLDRAR
jgi:peptide/nickel transport system substrate-binding protein